MDKIDYKMQYVAEPGSAAATDANAPTITKDLQNFGPGSLLIMNHSSNLKLGVRVGNKGAAFANYTPIDPMGNMILPNDGTNIVILAEGSDVTYTIMFIPSALIGITYPGGAESVIGRG